jgi:hypothetical protein
MEDEMEKPRGAGKSQGPAGLRGGPKRNGPERNGPDHLPEPKHGKGEVSYEKGHKSKDPGDLSGAEVEKNE